MKRIAVVEDEVYMREELCNMLERKKIQFVLVLLRPLRRNSLAMDKATGAVIFMVQVCC